METYYPFYRDVLLFKASGFIPGCVGLWSSTIACPFHLSLSREGRRFSCITGIRVVRSDPFLFVCSLRKLVPYSDSEFGGVDGFSHETTVWSFSNSLFGTIRVGRSSGSLRITVPLLVPPRVPTAIYWFPLLRSACLHGRVGSHVLASVRPSSTAVPGPNKGPTRRLKSPPPESPGVPYRHI